MILLDELPALKVVRDEMRIPQHRVPISINKEIHYPLLLTSIDSTYKSERNTLVFERPSTLLPSLPRHVQDEWESLGSRIKDYQNELRFHNVPLMKRIVREYRAGTKFQDFPLATIDYRLGAVPALLVGKCGEFDVALFPEWLRSGSREPLNTDEEIWEELNSLDHFLKPLFLAYYEAISYYFHSIFFGTNDAKITAFCGRIRDIAVGSIQSKLDRIEDCKGWFRRSHQLSLDIRDKYSEEINRGHAVYNFSHLLVNYIYKFYCLKDRTEEYYTRLKDLPSRRSIHGPDNVGLLQECADNLRRNSTNNRDNEGFYEQLSRVREGMDPWLYDLCETSSFIAEVNNYIPDSQISRPHVFITTHFGVKDSENFMNNLISSAHDNWPGINFVHGRHIDSQIRWPMLSRIWFSDYHVIFLPGSWLKNDGREKLLRRNKNWVIIELVYGNLLKRDISCIVQGEVPRSDFIRNVEEYTADKEIPQISNEGWLSFIGNAKSELVDFLGDHKYIPYSSNTKFDDRFTRQFQKDISAGATKNLARALFRAWYYFFSKDTWTVAQTLIEMKYKLNYKTITIRDLARRIAEKRGKHKEFQWAERYRELSDLENAIRNNHVRSKDEKRFGIRHFAFVLNGQHYYPIRVDNVGRLMFSVDIDSPLRQISKHCASLDSDNNLIKEIIEDLLKVRHE